MSSERIWNDDAREELLNRLRGAIIGELRLGSRRHEEILEDCRNVHIEYHCPDDEIDGFVQFAADEIGRAEALLECERSTWPEVTDCDRLDRVENALRERGILLWQVSPCCDTCTVADISMRIDKISEKCPGFGDRVRGYAFFIEQNLADTLCEGSQLSVCLGYGWLSGDHSKVAADVYRRHALGIAREVCDCLRAEGFKPAWNGDFAKKICVTLNWQRRTLLE